LGAQRLKARSSFLMFTLSHSYIASQFSFHIFQLFQQQPQQLHGAAAALAAASHIFRRLMINYFSIKRQHKTQHKRAERWKKIEIKYKTRHGRGQPEMEWGTDEALRHLGLSQSGSWPGLGGVASLKKH